MRSLFKVGDCVMIKNLDDMKNEYGMINGTSAINVPFNFTQEMYRFCGDVYVVKEIQWYSSKGTFRYIFEADSAINGYLISEEMLTLAYVSQDECVCGKNLTAIFGG